MSTVLFSTNFLNKASGLLLLLVCVSTGHAHFLDDKIHEPMRPTTVFFSCSMPEKCSGKATHKVCREVLYTPSFLTRKKNHLRAKTNTLILTHVVSQPAMLNRQQHVPRCSPTLKSCARYNYATHLFQYVGVLWCVCFGGSRTHERWPR